jgi:cell division protein FtsB
MSQLVIVLLVVALMGAMAIEPARQLLEQRKRITGMKSSLDEVKAGNADLRDRIRRLGDTDFVEQRAREQIGLVRPGEQVFAVVPPSRKAKARKAKALRRERRVERRSAPKPTEEPTGFFGGLLEFIGF